MCTKNEVVKEFFGAIADEQGESFPRHALDPYRKLLRKVLGYYSSRGLSKADAEELSQDVFLSMWRHRHTLLYQDDPNRYFWKSVSNRLASFWEKKGRAPLSVDYEETLSGVASEINTEQTVATSNYERCYLNVLRDYGRSYPNHINAVLLAAHGNLTLNEVADVIGSSPGALRQMLSAVRSKLRDRVNARCGPCPIKTVDYLGGLL